jgi:HMG (high mobility group) box
LFRRKCCEERHAPEGSAPGAVPDEGSASSPVKKQRQADLSKTISQQWKSLSQEERQFWEDLAKEKKKEHEQMYPNYVYRPQRTKPAKGKKPKGVRKVMTGESEQDTDAESFSCTLPVNLAPSSSRLHHGRARSAPTPPLTYQTIQIPAVYMPSCPSSPSLYPTNLRRTPLPRLSIDQDLPASMTYHSDDSLALPPFPHPHDFEAHLQVPIFCLPSLHLFSWKQD